jgi:hypothetical protein
VLSLLVRWELIPAYTNKHTLRWLVNFSVTFESLVEFVLGHYHISVILPTTSLEFLEISLIVLLCLVLNHFLLLMILINKSLFVNVIEFIDTFKFKCVELLVIPTLFFFN